MKKRYFIISLAIITTIAYIDLVENCREIDKTIANILQVDNTYKTKLIVKKNPYFKTLTHPPRSTKRL